MAQTRKIGKCEVCKNAIYQGGRSRLYIGHDPKCKNAGTERLKA